MPTLISCPTFKDPRGHLTVIDRLLPFEIKRVFYIYNANLDRGGHRHHKTIQALICVAGQCEVFIDNGQSEAVFTLDSPDKCLIVQPEDWHIMRAFSLDAVLLVLASESFDADDYIDERPIR